MASRSWRRSRAYAQPVPASPIRKPPGSWDATTGLPADNRSGRARGKRSDRRDACRVPRRSRPRCVGHSWQWHQPGSRTVRGRRGLSAWEVVGGGGTIQAEAQSDFRFSRWSGLCHRAEFGLHQVDFRDRARDEIRHRRSHGRLGGRVPAFRQRLVHPARTCRARRDDCSSSHPSRYTTTSIRRRCRASR